MQITPISMLPTQGLKANNAMNKTQSQSFGELMNDRSDFGDLIDKRNRLTLKIAAYKDDIEQKRLGYEDEETKMPKLTKMLKVIDTELSSRQANKKGFDVASVNKKIAEIENGNSGFIKKLVRFFK